MITSERIKELLNQDKEIYVIENNKVYELRHKDCWVVKEDCIEWYCKETPKFVFCHPFKNLFENKLDAEKFLDRELELAYKAIELARKDFRDMYCSDYCSGSCKTEEDYNKCPYKKWWGVNYIQLAKGELE